VNEKLVTIDESNEFIRQRDKERDIKRTEKQKKERKRIECEKITQTKFWLLPFDLLFPILLEK
jgi:hypothetical protein